MLELCYIYWHFLRVSTYGVHHGGDIMFYSLNSHPSGYPIYLSIISDDKSLNEKKYNIVPVLSQALYHEGTIFKLST